MAKKNWIKGAISKPGSLRKSLGVKKGEKIPAGKLRAAAKKGGKMGKRARLAMTLKKFHTGGYVPEDGLYWLQHGETVTPSPGVAGHWTDESGEIEFVEDGEDDQDLEEDE